MKNFTFPQFKTSNNPYCTVVYNVSLNGLPYNYTSYFLNIYNSSLPGFDNNTFTPEKVYLSIYNNTNYYSNGTY